MNKEKLLQEIIEQLEKDRVALLEATRATLEAATHEESVAENEYDTRGLEASYLAGAQSKRVAEIEEALSIYKHLNLRSFTKEDTIASTALVELVSEGKKSYVILMPKAGGMTLHLDGYPVQVVTGTSPLGEALLGLRIGDSALVESGTYEKEYEVLNVW